MSFPGTANRSYDPLSHPELAHLRRTSDSPLNSYNNVSQSPMHPLIHQSTPHSTNHQSHAADRSRLSLPQIGQTRCYWALLSTNLRFLYLDPVLAHHLREQADTLIGKSLLQFVHPDEQTSAEQDLGGVLESRTLHGSVTRVRFSRLSRVRRELGACDSSVVWSDAEKIAVDDNYMAVDIVINWAADGVVLCFIHAVVDLEPRDNDELRKTGWTNWCGTPYMSQNEVNLLFERLCHLIPPASSMDRVFQILLNQPDRPLWVSWPADRQQVQGGPISKDFAKLAVDVNLGNQSNGPSEAKTSCTRRYKAQQTMSFGVDGYRDVESIFIPYGSIIFACHKIESPSTSKPSNGYMHHQSSSQYYDNPAYSLPPMSGQQEYPHAAYAAHPAAPQYAPQSWSGSDNSQQSYTQWNTQHTGVSSSPSVSSIRSSSYQPQQDSQQPQQAQHQWSSQPPVSAYMDPNSASGYFPTGTYATTPSVGTPATEQPPAAPAEDVVPAARTGRRAAKDQLGGNRNVGNPPNGIMKCSSCKVTQSPEWRKGPSGKKDLCNACGLRYARSRAKKEGGTTRRRKDKVLAAMSNKSEQPSPALTPINIPFNGMRRGNGYDENSLNSSAGSEGYSHMHEHAPSHAPPLPGQNGLTPSPPPSGNPGNFMGYQQPPDQHHHAQSERAHPQYAHAQPYYSLPTLVPTSMPHGGASVPLPRLDLMTGLPYSNRVSNSPPSPMPTSHFAQPSSYERERHLNKDRERMVMPPTPISADPRIGTGKY
ncbi:hypothetical protein BDY19DRAFT_938792 [Irpex rosettiformis]|uniref:Uncharacterized protein n=1 Tax=Irpex rosettiformis TaxID=378272 RepID=A0ACB8U741_9APHY|nr:hypothetical protein BDY19DRAFT_938792 [Irpex rosettiformis]